MDPKPKGKASSLLSKKVAGVPVPVLLVVGGVAVYYLYSKFRGSSSAAPAANTADTVPGYATGDDSGSGGGGGGGSSPATGTGTATGTDYTGTGSTGTTSTTPPIFDTAQPGNPYGAGVAYVEPGIGDLPPGVLPVTYSPPNTTTLSPASGALASNPAQGGHSL